MISSIELHGWLGGENLYGDGTVWLLGSKHLNLDQNNNSDHSPARNATRRYPAQGLDPLSSLF